MAYSLRDPVNPPSSRQKKVTMQRQYREKEGECFNTLQDVIKKLTGEEPQTRYEILRKAIDLVSEIRRHRAAKVVSPVLYGMPPSTNPADTTVTQAHSGYSAQPSPNCPQTWPTNAEFVAQSAYYTTQFCDQQYDFMSDMESALAFYATHEEYHEGWSNYPQGGKTVDQVLDSLFPFK